jgi:hypothetical protein
MKGTHLSVWAVTHVCPQGLASGGPKANQTYLAVAVSGQKATARVHLTTGLPYDELHTMLVRRDPTPVPAEDWNPALERCLGSVRDFWPRTCPVCKGLDKRCSACKGTGTKHRRSRPVSG